MSETDDAFNAIIYGGEYSPYVTLQRDAVKELLQVTMAASRAEAEVPGLFASLEPFAPDDEEMEMFLETIEQEYGL